MAFGIPDTMEMRSGYDYMDRLYPPEEWQELPPGVKSSFQNYMDYVNQFQRQQRAKRNAPQPLYGGTQRVGQGGGSFGAAGQPITIGGGRGSFQGATTKGGSAIPDYRTHIGLGGKPTYETRGGRRTITGEFIPTSMGEEREELQRRTAIPTMEAETIEALISKQAKAMAARRGLRTEEYLATKTPKEMYETTIRGQEAQRIEQAGEKIGIRRSALELQDQKYQSRLSDFDYKEKIKQNYRQANIRMYEELRSAREGLQRQYDMAKLKALGKIPDTKESKIRLLEELDFFKRKANVNADNAKTLEDERFHNSMTKQLDAQIFWLERDLAKPKTKDELRAEQMATPEGEETVDLRGRTKALLGKKQAQTVVEVEQVQPDGRVAVFDKTTGQFIGWK